MQDLRAVIQLRDTASGQEPLQRHLLPGHIFSQLRIDPASYHGYPGRSHYVSGPYKGSRCSVVQTIERGTHLPQNRDPLSASGTEIPLIVET